MPKVTRSKRYSKGRRYRPYKKPKSSFQKQLQWTGNMEKLSPQRGIYGFPSDLITKIRYCDIYSLTSTASSIAKQVFRMNSINDPDQTGTGHQPLYHDQLQALYERYVVLGAKLTVQFVQVPSPIANAQPSGPVTVGVLAENNASSASLLSTLLENNTSKSKNLLAESNGDAWFTITYSPEKDLGVGADDDTVHASFGSNPSVQWYGTLFACDTNGITAVTVNAKVTLEYTVKCMRQIDIGGS